MSIRLRPIPRLLPPVSHNISCQHDFSADPWCHAGSQFTTSSDNTLLFRVSINSLGRSLHPCRDTLISPFASPICLARLTLNTLTDMGAHYIVPINSHVYSIILFISCPLPRRHTNNIVTITYSSISYEYNDIYSTKKCTINSH